MNNILKEDEIQRGRTIVVAIIVSTLTFSLLVAITYNLHFGPTKILIHIIRFLLAITLLWFLYKGYNWARWVNIVLFTMAGVFTILSGIELMTKFLFGLTMVIMSVVYLGSASFLLFSSNVTAFLNYQKSKMKKYKTNS